MGEIQLKYIEYVEKFANSNKTHIWLGGSFLHGGYTVFSDVDISVLGNEDILNNLIYGYGQPIYISYTNNPRGILIVIYADGVALDLEIIKKIDISGSEYFHRTDIKTLDYFREENVCTHFALCNDMSYQISRLFHRSLIKFLSGKRDNGVSIINEVVTFMNSQEFLDEKDYHSKFINILRSYNERFPLPIAYYELLCELIVASHKVKLAYKFQFAGQSKLSLPSRK